MSFHTMVAEACPIFFVSWKNFRTEITRLCFIHRLDVGVAVVVVVVVVNTETSKNAPWMRSLSSTFQINRINAITR